MTEKEKMQNAQNKKEQKMQALSEEQYMNKIGLGSVVKDERDSLIDEIKLTGDLATKQFRERKHFFDPEVDDLQTIRETPLAPGETDYGQSKYDDNPLHINRFDDKSEELIQNRRASQQSGLTQMALGLTRGLVLTGTTAIDGTAGLVYGIGSAIKEGEFDQLWNNELSKWLDSINEDARKAMPVYESTTQENNPWIQNIGRAGFWSSIVENSGFMAGSILGGKLPAGMIGKLGGKVASVAGKTAAEADKIAAASAQAGGVLSMAMNEAGVQARETYNNAMKAYAKPLNDEYDARLRPLNQKVAQMEERLSVLSSMIDREGALALPETIAEYEQLMSDYEYVRNMRDGIEKEKTEKIKSIEESAFAAGNLDYIQNLAILAPMDMIGVGKMYRRGFDKSVESSLIKGKWGDYSVDAKSKWSAIGNIGNEAAQEVAQNISGKTAVNYYSADAINRYRKMNDPEAEEEVSSYMQSLAKGFGEGIMDPQAWEEAFSVAVTMGFGHPVIRSKNEMKDADGNKRSRIGWGNSVFNEISDISRNNKNAQEIVDVMNKFSKDPGTYEMMSGLVHHRAMDKAMAEALSQKDEFDYRNAEYQQMLGDISAFSRAGRIGDLINSMQRGKDLSDEDLENMIAQSTGINEEGRLFGPYSEYARLDPEGNIISRELTDEDKKSVREKIDKNVGKQMELIDKWDKIRREHMSRFGNGSNDALIDELTYMRLYFEHFPDRAKEMGEDMKSVYDKLTESMKGTIAREEQQATEDLKKKEDEIYRKEDRLKLAATKDENYLKDDDGFFIAPEDDYRKSYNRHQEAIQKLDKSFEDKKNKHEEFIKKHSDREDLYKKQIEGAERDVEKAERELKTAQKAIEDKTKEKENLDKLIIKKRKDVRKAISAAKKGSTLKSEKSDTLENEIEKLTSQTKAIEDEIETYKSSAKDAEEEVRKAKNTQKKHLRDIEKARKEDAKEREEEAKRFENDAKAYNDKRKEYLEAQKRIEDNIARLAENARKEQEELKTLKDDYDRTMAQYEKARENNRVLETAMDMLLKGDISWFVNAENFMSNDEVQSPSDLIDMSIENIGKTAELLGMSETEVSSLVGKLNDMAQCIANMKKIKDQYNKYVDDLSKLEKDMDNIDRKADKERKRKEADRSHKEFKEDVDDMSLKSLLDNKDKIEAELERRKNDLSDSEKAAIERAKRDSESEPDFKDKLSQYLMDDGRSKEETDSLLAKIAENEDLQETKLAIMEAEALKNAIDKAVKEIDDPLMRTFFDRAFKKLMSRTKNAKTVLAPNSDVLLDPKGVFGEDEYAKDAELIDSFADENIRESVIEKANFYFKKYFDELRKTKEAKESFDSAPKTESEGTVQEDEDKSETASESPKTDDITPGEKIDQSVSSANYNILSTTEFVLYDDKELKKKWKDLEPEWKVAEREGKSAYNQYTPERNKRLKMVWEYLNEKGVFQDRRDHRIPDETEVFYLVDLDFCKKIQNELNESNITNDNCFVIFYAVKDGDEYRIIGDVKPEWAIINDEGSEVIPGLRSVISNIRNEVAASSQETGMFVSGYRNKTRGNGNNDASGMGLIAVTENTFNTLGDVFTDSEGRKLIPEFELQDDENDGKKNVAVKIRYADTENYRTRLVRLPKTLSDCGKDTEFRKDAEKLIDQWLADPSQKASDDLFKMFYYTETEKGGSKFWNEARRIAKEKGKEAAKKFIIDGGDNGHKAYLSFDFTKLANGDTGYANKTKDVIKVDIHKGQYKTINNFFTLYALDPNGNIMDGRTDATKDFSFSDNGDNMINVDNSGKYHVVERDGTYTLYEGENSVLSTENETDVQSITGEDGDRKKKLLAKAYVIRNAYAGSVAVRIPFLGGNVFYIMDQDKLVGVDEAQSLNTDTDTQKTISVTAPSVIEKTEPTQEQPQQGTKTFVEKGEKSFDEMFNIVKDKYKDDKSLSQLVNLVFNALKNTGIKFKEVSNDEEISGTYVASENVILYDKERLQDNTLLHEAIHAATTYYLKAANNEDFSDEIKIAIAEINECYNLLKQDYIETHFYENGKPKDGVNIEKAFGFWIQGDQSDYGFTDPFEMVAELSNPNFVAKIKDFDERHKGENVFEWLIDAIARLFGINKKYDNVEKTLKKALTALLLTPNKDLYNRYSLENKTIKNNLRKLNDIKALSFVNKNSVSEMLDRLGSDEGVDYVDSYLRVASDLISSSFELDIHDDFIKPRIGTIIKFSNGGEGSLFFSINGKSNKEGNDTLIPVRVYSRKGLSSNDFVIKTDESGYGYISELKPLFSQLQSVQNSTSAERNNEVLETFVLGTKMAYDPDDKLTILSFDQTDERTLSLAVTEAITAIESGASVSVDNSNFVLTDRLTATGYDKTESDGKTVFTAKNFDVIKETWGQGMQFVSENAVQDDNSGIFFSTSGNKGFSAYTKDNAKDTDITVNFSPNKRSGGYKKTEDAAGDRFFDVNDSTTADDFEGKLKSLNLTKESPLKVNIAGNGLNEAKDMDQKAFDNDVYKFLKKIKDAGFNIVYIRTGGETGADEAGAMAGRKLGIVTEVHGPADWIFRPQDGRDIKDETAYKERFARTLDIEESQTAFEPVSNVETPVAQPTKEQQQQPVQNEAPASSEKRTLSGEDAKNFIKLHIRNNLLKIVEGDASAGDKALIDAIAEAAYDDLSEEHMPYEENGQRRFDDDAINLIRNQAHDKVDKYLNANLDNKSFQSSSNVLLDAIDGRRKKDANRPLANVIANQQLPPSQGNGGSYTFTSCQETIEMPFPLNEGQKQALDKIDKFLAGDDDKVFVLKGYAGTGKTSIIRAVKQLFDKKKGGKVFEKTLDLRATTGAACVAMNDALGILEVDTVASLTAKSVSRGNSVWAPLLDGKVIVVDESSMLNSSEFQKLMTSLDYDDCKIIFVGDPAQLAPVESGTDHSKVFDINTTDKTSHELTQVMRTGDNAILREATNVRTNGKNFSYESSFNEKGEGVAFISNSKAFVDSAIEIFKRCRETGEEAMICAYENKDVIDYNRKVRESLGFSGDQFQVGETTMYYGQNRKTSVGSKAIMELVNGGTYKVLKASENTNTDKEKHERYRQYFLDMLNRLEYIENGYMSRFEHLIKYIFDKGLVYQVQVESELDKRGSKSNAQTVSYVDANKMSQEMKEDYAKFCAEVAYLNLAYSDAMDSFALLPMITQKNTDLDKSLLGSEFKGKDNAVKLYLQKMHTTRTGGKPLSDAQFGRISMMKPLERTIDYGYASTVHKSQGKTIDHILVDMQKVETNSLLNEKDRRELAYVGVTRARKTATIFTSATKREGNPVTGEVDSKIKDTHGLSIFSASEGASGRPKFTPNESSKPNFHPDNIPNFDPGESGEPARQQGLFIRSHINIVSQEDKGKVSHKEHLMFNRNMPSLSMEARATFVSAINDCLGKRDFVAIRKAKEAAAYLAFGNNNPLSRKQAMITMLPFMVGADEAKRLTDKYGETNLYSLMKKYLDAGIDDEIGDNDRKAFDTANAFVKALEKGRNNVNSVFDSLTQGKDVERESNPVMFMSNIGNKAIEGIETNGWSAKEIEHYKNVCL